MRICIPFVPLGQKILKLHSISTFPFLNSSSALIYYYTNLHYVFSSTVKWQYEDKCICVGHCNFRISLIQTFKRDVFMYYLRDTHTRLVPHSNHKQKWRKVHKLQLRWNNCSSTAWPCYKTVPNPIQAPYITPQTEHLGAKADRRWMEIVIKFTSLQHATMGEAYKVTEASKLPFKVTLAHYNQLK